MIHEEVIRRYYDIQPENTSGWRPVRTDDATIRKSFPGTQGRIAKIRDGRYLYYTVGETVLGKQHKLSQSIIGIIKSKGLRHIEDESTNHSSHIKRTYVGFDFSLCSAEVLLDVLQAIDATIRNCSEKA